MNEAVRLPAAGRGGRLLVALLLLLAALPADARDVAGLYGATVAVADRSSQALARGAAAALAQVLVKLTGDRGAAARAEVKPVIARASHLMLRYAYATDADGGLRLRAEFDEQALATELHERGVAVWGKERPDTIAWLVIDGDTGRQLVGGDAPGSAGEALLERADARGLPVLLPLVDIEEAQRLGNAADTAAVTAAALALSDRYGTPAALVGHVREIAPGAWQARWSLRVDGDTLEWAQADAPLATLVSDGIDTLGDALARRYADPAMLAAAERVSMTVYDVRTAADYARLSSYLASLDTIQQLFVQGVDRERVRFELTARGGRAALAQSIAFGRLLEPVGGEADAYRLLP